MYSIKLSTYAFLLLFLFPLFLFSQNQATSSKFDSIFYDTGTNIASKDFNKALNIADSLYVYSDLEVYKIRALMLSALLYQKNGTSDKTINMLLKQKK